MTEGRTSQWWQRRTTPLVRFALDATSPPCHTSNVRHKNMIWKNYILIAIVAAGSGIFGFFVLGGRLIDWPFYLWVTGASVLMWTGFGILYRSIEFPWFHAFYLGLLSPFIGAILVAPPWSFVLLYSKPVFSILLGLITSLSICLIAHVNWGDHSWRISRNSKGRTAPNAEPDMGGNECSATLHTRTSI